jgi:hypothetical protein
MEVTVILSDWRVVETDSKTKTIAGSFTVKCGNMQIAKESFNDQYSSQKIPFSAKLLAEIEEFDDKIKAELTNHFKGE